MSLSGLYSQRLPTVLTVLGLARAGRARIRTIGAGSIWDLDGYPLPWGENCQDRLQDRLCEQPCACVCLPAFFPVSLPSGATP